MTQDSLNSLMQRERRLQRILMGITIIVVAIAAFAARSERALFDFGAPSPSAFAALRSEPLILSEPSNFLRRLPLQVQRLPESGLRPVPDLAELGEAPQLYVGPVDALPVGTGFVDLGDFALNNVPDPLSAPPRTGFPSAASQSISPTPEPAIWLFMIFGFGTIGLAMRRTQAQRRAAIV